MTDFTTSETDSPRRAGRNAAAIVIGLVVVTIPFGWSLWSSYADYRRYVETTLEVPEDPPIWVRRSLTADDCVSEALAWAERCPGFEELCRRALPAVVGRCLASRDRRAWCEANGDTLTTASYGDDACEEAIDARRLDDTRTHRHRCAVAYGAVAAWCEAQPPPPRARVDVNEP
ncbi:MAG: hypothetical protein RIF41_01645 [Polyangiaceae bacterium]